MECTLYTIENSRTNEKRTSAVIIITVSMMIAEIISGLLFGSMSLLADGIHMGTHAVALGIALVAYRVARSHHKNRNFAFGTGKVGVLGGYTSAVLLIIAAFGMIYESGERLFNPVQIHFEEALIVAVVGLIVNLVSAILLGHDHVHENHVHEKHVHEKHVHEKHVHEKHVHENHVLENHVLENHVLENHVLENHVHENHVHENHVHENHVHEDHNLRAAYLHVIADAVTSIAAILALLAGRLFNAVWLDSVVAVVGSIMIFRWAIGLIKDTGSILLDYHPSESMRSEISEIVSKFNGKLHDFHCWKIDASQLGVIMMVSDLDGADCELRKIIEETFPVIHCTIESR